MLDRIKKWWTNIESRQRKWIIFSTLAVLLLGLIARDTFINILIGVVGMFYVSCYSAGKKEAFLMGVVYVALYTIICLQNRIMLDALQNIILIPIYIASYVHWNNKAVSPKNMTWKQRLISLGCLLILIIALFGLSKLLHGNYSMLDSINTSCTLFAMVLGYYGYTENWIGWTINNFVSAVTFGLVLATPTGSVAVFCMKLIFLLNGLIGWYNFRKAGK